MYRKMGLSVLSLLLNSPTWCTCTHPREPIIMSPTFGHRFSDASEIERGKGKTFFLKTHHIPKTFCIFATKITLKRQEL
jgi:hypothetical protein